MSSRQPGSTGAARDKRDQQATVSFAEAAHDVRERQRLDEAREAGIPWKKWVPT